MLEFLPVVYAMRAELRLGFGPVALLTRLAPLLQQASRLSDLKTPLSGA